VDWVTVNVKMFCIIVLQGRPKVDIQYIVYRKKITVYLLLAHSVYNTVKKSNGVIAQPTLTY